MPTMRQGGRTSWPRSSLAKIPVSKGDTEAEQLVASRRTTPTQMASVISGVRCGLEYLPQVFRTVKDSWELCIAQEAKGRRFNYEQDYYFFFFLLSSVGWGL